MLTKKLNPSLVLCNSQIRCCSTNATRLINLVKVMKKEPGRSSLKEEMKAGSLNLFKHQSPIDKQVKSKNLWSELEQEELKLYNQKPARNGFEEMINWTNEGKLWNYPINNEQGLEHLTEKEKFYDHVFFDDIIEKSPNKQPIREFMNDAALGLAQNPFMTSERKRNYLEWYNSYFNENKELVDTLIDEEDELSK